MKKITYTIYSQKTGLSTKVENWEEAKTIRETLIHDDIEYLSWWPIHVNVENVDGSITICDVNHNTGMPADLSLLDEEPSTRIPPEE